MSPARLALIVAIVVFTLPATARADVTPGPEQVPVEVLQRLLCEQEQAYDSCGEGARGERLVCGNSSCKSGPCLLCVRHGESPSSDRRPPEGIHTARLRLEERFDPDRDPAVARSTLIAGVGFLVTLLALLGFALFPRRAATPLVAGLTLTAGIVVSMVGLFGRDMAVDAYGARYEEGREVVLIPVHAHVAPTREQRAAWQEHIDQLKRLLDAKGRPWRHLGS